MIDSEVTFREKGYCPEDLSPKSQKRVWRVCDACGQGRWIEMEYALNICKSCSGRRGAIINHSQGHSAETRKKMSDAKKGKSSKRKGMITLMDVKKKISATRQGISYDEWEKFAINQPYCPKFNEVCRESNREKYDRKCFLCGVAEENNRDKTGKSRRLSVHHIDLNKAQGCNGHRWKLIPVCMHCHGRLHKEPWISRIQYLLV